VERRETGEMPDALLLLSGRGIAAMRFLLGFACAFSCVQPNLSGFLWAKLSISNTATLDAAISATVVIVNGLVALRKMVV
jgi:hypothetical protein